MSEIKNLSKVIARDVIEYTCEIMKYDDWNDESDGAGCFEISFNQSGSLNNMSAESLIALRDCINEFLSTNNLES